MGLDMYLKAKTYASEYTRPELYEKVKEAMGMTHYNEHLEVTMCVGYWRKANAVHAWFVDNVQDGRDECQESYVSREQLLALRNICAEAIDRKDCRLLEPRSGFFFGSTDIDQFYWDDLQHTVDTLDKVLGDETLKDTDFYYRASW